jgi:hypothetical protein
MSILPPPVRNERDFHLMPARTDRPTFFTSETEETKKPTRKANEKKKKIKDEKQKKKRKK